MKRHLPIIQSQSGGREGEERSPLAWRAIGATLAFTLWLPLSMLGGALGRALVSTWVDSSNPEQLARFARTASGSETLLLTLALSGPAMLAFVIACGISGALVGRFGTTARPRDAGIGGVVASCGGMPGGRAGRGIRLPGSGNPGVRGFGPGGLRQRGLCGTDQRQSRQIRLGSGP